MESIEIKLKLMGNQGLAEGAGKAEIERTQALALSNLLKKLKKDKKLRGRSWTVRDHPELRGVI